MRIGLCVILPLLALAACAGGTTDPRLAENWRQSDGSPVDPLAFDTVRQVCDAMVPQAAASRPATPLAVAPPYRPGGEGFASASPLSIGSAGSSFDPAFADSSAGQSAPASPAGGARYPDMASCIGSVGWRPTL